MLGFYNEKAKQWVKGRKAIFKQLSSAFSHNRQPVIWLHCSSLGEFEQGRPVLESIRKKYPQYKLLLTFFSPSGYEIRKNYEGADHVFYLPMDGPSHANRFLNIVQPGLVIFVKYEFWNYYLHETRQRNIPLLMVSGIFRKEQPFFQWYGGFHKQMLDCFTHFFVQNQSSVALLAGAGLTENVSLSGDTRFDRVITIANQFQPITLVEHFCDGHQVIVAGSTWTEDDEALDHFANTHPRIRFIIAPHAIEADRLKECLSLYKHAMLYSAYEAAVALGVELPSSLNVLIIDNMGMLSKLYHYATICYIGGGFGDDGIHNILEAAVYAKPVLFGPVYDKYFEATELLNEGGAFSVEDALELERMIHELLTQRQVYDQAAAASLNYVRTNSGATEKIMQYIQEKRLLTN
ncbi:MAG: glycosyltransferase N-terminal domain-containing protein [Sediminibacterium sp.]